jgi:hypothetical protein
MTPPLDILAVAVARLDVARALHSSIPPGDLRVPASYALLEAYEDIERCHFLAADLAREGNRVVGS